LEEDLDLLPPLGEGKATARRGAIVSYNYSDLATHMTWSLVRGSDWSGRFGPWKGIKPSRFLKSSPPRSITTPGNSLFKKADPSSHPTMKMMVVTPR
jgi:hypothetical protein